MLSYPFGVKMAPEVLANDLSVCKQLIYALYCSVLIGRVFVSSIAAHMHVAMLLRCTVRRDASLDTEITSQSGPAMTWAIFAIGWMEVSLQPGNQWSGNYSRAIHFFQRGYANVQKPFNVWRETPSGGAVNFITGIYLFIYVSHNTPHASTARRRNLIKLVYH